MSIEALPRELQLEILNKLSTNDLLALSQTTKLFQDLSNGDAVWQSRAADPNKFFSSNSAQKTQLKAARIKLAKEKAAIERQKYLLELPVLYERYRQAVNAYELSKTAYERACSAYLASMGFYSHFVAGCEDYGFMRGAIISYQFSHNNIPEQPDQTEYDRQQVRAFVELDLVFHRLVALGYDYSDSEENYYNDEAYQRAWSKVEIDYPEISKQFLSKLKYCPYNGRKIVELTDTHYSPKWERAWNSATTPAAKLEALFKLYRRPFLFRFLDFLTRHHIEETKSLVNYMGTHRDLSGQQVADQLVSYALIIIDGGRCHKMLNFACEKMNVFASAPPEEHASCSRLN